MHNYLCPPDYRLCLGDVTGYWGNMPIHVSRTDGDRVYWGLNVLERVFQPYYHSMSWFLT